MNSGRYADFGNLEGSVGIFTISGSVRSGLADVYEVDLSAALPTAGSITITLRFGPQGRNFDSIVSVEGGVEAELESIGITLGDVNFSSELISISIAGQTLSYTRDQVNTQLANDIIAAGATNVEIADKAAEIIGAGMDAATSFDKFFVINADTLPPRETFTAKFEDAVVSSVGTVERSFSTDEFLTVSQIGIYDENYIFVVYDEGDLSSNRMEIWYREDASSGSASGIPGLLMGGDLHFHLVTHDYQFEGVQYLLDPEDGVQVAFDNSFDFGSGATNGGIIVDGTASADVIDNTYVDVDGDNISNDGQEILAGDGNDRIYDGGGDDTVEGGAGQDQFYAGSGADSYDGGADRDQVFYTTANSGLTIDTTNAANSTGLAAGDTFANIEFVHGSDFNDIIVADVERIFGRDGDDVLQDRAGVQQLIGGYGADTFRFSADDGVQDRVADFTIGEDMFDVSLWGATQLSDLAIYESTNGQGTLQGRLNVEYNGESVRVDGLNTADIASLTSDHFIFA